MVAMEFQVAVAVEFLELLLVVLVVMVEMV